MGRNYDVNPATFMQIPGLDNANIDCTTDVAKCVVKVDVVQEQIPNDYTITVYYRAEGGAERFIDDTTFHVYCDGDSTDVTLPTEYGNGDTILSWIPTYDLLYNDPLLPQIIMKNAEATVPGCTVDTWTLTRDGL